MLPPVHRGVPLGRAEYDYVVVGAGSAGSVVSSRLSEDAATTVGLIEAGGWAMHPLVHIPAGVYHVFKDPDLNWNYRTEPEPGCAGRRMSMRPQPLSQCCWWSEKRRVVVVCSDRGVSTAQQAHR
jgi:choline dehydrogenase-like flavoprotein